ncbi:MAG: type II toxin-antitoxin system VapC family toxin [Terrimicrobiaceae bacterium]
MSRMTYLVDTGPLVSAFARREPKYKSWAEELLGRLPLPLVTCEAVITEASHLLGSSVRLMEAIDKKLIVCRFDLQREARLIGQLCAKYADQPMDLADACLVRLYETHREGSATILTVDRTDFTVYRTSKGKPLRCEFPPADRK